MAVFSRTGSRRLCRVGRRRDESGGAVSLWVVLMVPVSAFAAVVAMAGPQRVAAESTMQDAADDLAMLAVAWRDGQGMKEGPLPAFPPECSNEGQSTRFDAEIGTIPDEIVRLDEQIGDLTPGDEQIQTLEDTKQDEQARLTELEGLKVDVLANWKAACDLLFDSLLRDLGYLGVDMGSLRGFYSDSLSMSPEVVPPCRVSSGTKVEDAVHVALAADWQDAGWAAAQVWPDGTRVAAESMGRLSHRVAATSDDKCEKWLTVLDEWGRPVLDPDAESRKLSRSVARTSLSG